MNKFKVGDKVMVVEHIYADNHTDLRVGDSFVIGDIEKSSALDNNGVWLMEEGSGNGISSNLCRLFIEKVDFDSSDYGRLFKEIEHGDREHRNWLYDKMKDFYDRLATVS